MKLCSNATPRLKSACALALPELRKVIVPSARSCPETVAIRPSAIRRTKYFTCVERTTKEGDGRSRRPPPCLRSFSVSRLEAKPEHHLRQAHEASQGVNA